MSNSVRSRRLLLCGASLAGLLATQPALAQTVSGIRGTANPSAGAANPNSGAPVTTLPPLAQSALARQNALKARTATAMDLANQAQQAARAAALAKPSTTPNGLVTGGLVPAGAITTDPSLWQNANAPTQTTGSDGKTTVEIDQTAQKAILTWDSFNVGKDTTLYFNQSKGTQSDGSNEWIALNRINDPSLAPSKIEGMIKAEGSVYLINRNGIMFTGTSQVNTHSLIVSAGDLFSSNVATSNQQFLNGGINDPTWGQAILGTNGQNAGMGAITIDGGADIETKEGGFSIFFGQNVTNSGNIVSNGGQSILAAGAGLVLNNTGSGILKPQLVGFSRDADGVTLNSVVLNNGSVIGLRGDVTLLGATIEQNGIAMATTSISQPGTITISNGVGSGVINNGTVLFGANSLTAILPDANGETTSTTQAAVDNFEPGTATIQGGSIWFQSGSTLQMPGATLNVSAGVGGTLAGPDAGDLVSGRIYVDDDAVISVAGLADVQRAMSDNIVTVARLGQNELADSPLQQDGILYTSPFTVDSRDSGTREDGLSWVGTPVANVSGYTQSVPQTVNELLTNGGTINFNVQGGNLGTTGDASLFRTGSLIVASGATIDISGGYQHYLGGSVATSRLIGADGRVYDASTADPNMTYVGFAGQTTVSHDRWGVTDTYSSTIMSGGYESDYVQGGNGGALNITAQGGQVVLDGALYAQAVAGRYQIGAGKEPLGGSLSITAPGILLTKDGLTFDELGDDFGPGTSLVTPDSLAQPFNDPTNPLVTVNLSTDILTGAGFSKIDFNATMITSAAGSTLAVNPGGSIDFTASRMEIDGDLVAHSGGINLMSTGATGAGTAKSGDPAGNGAGVIYLSPGDGEQAAAPVAGDITVGENALLDVSGLWVNDTGLATDAGMGDSFVNGGSISLMTTSEIQRGYGTSVAVGQTPLSGYYDTTGAIILKSGSVLDASGGGYVDILGQVETQNGIPAGKGGDVSLVTYGTSGNFGALFHIGDVLTQQGDNSQPLTHGVVQMDGTIKDFGFAGGGTLTLQTLGIQIGGDQGSLPDYVTWLPGDWFASQGFGGYNLTALYDATIAPDTTVAVSQRNYTGDLAALALLPTGSDLSSAAAVSLGVTDPFHRQPTDFSLTGGGYLRWNTLSANSGGDDLLPNFTGITGTTLLGDGASILADAGASVTLASYGQLTDLGTIVAHGGSVSLTGITNLGNDYDFLSRSVWLGGDSLIDVSGVVLTDPFAAPVRTGNGFKIPNSGVVLDGGSVSIEGGNAYVIAEKGSRIDVSGADGTLDIRTQSSNPFAPVAYMPTEVASDAGSIQLGAGEGLYFDGTLAARGGNASARGGTLTIADVPVLDLQLSPGAPAAALAQALILQQSGDLVTSDMAAGGRIESGAAASKVMHFAADRLDGSGIDTLVLGGDPTATVSSTVASGLLPTIAFAGDVDLSLDRAVMMNASSYVALPDGTMTVPTQLAGNQSVGSGTVTISAPYVLMAGGSLTDIAPVLAGGDATLNVNAVQIDLMGQFQLQRFADANFTSSGDIRLLMPSNLAYINGSQVSRSGELVTAGDLTFKAGQVYPASGTVFILDAPSADSTITFLANGSVAPPDSVGGALLVDAANIVQDGTVRAPSGTIQLGIGDIGDADIKTAFNNLPLVNTSSVALGDGSLTSVSLDARSLPYGTTTDGTDWKLIVSDSNGNQVTTADLTQAPQKLISIAGTNVDFGDGATVDLSGGGQVYAQEFVPGTGGSRDLLTAVNQTYSSGAQPVSTPLYADGRQVYAVVPGYQSPLAAYDPSFGYSSGSGESEVGKSVYLSGVPGLPDGVYTLLPGQYATMPGAFRVVQETNITDSVASDNTVLPDGSNVVSGRFVDGLTGKQAARTTSFLVQSADVWKQYSSYTITDADDYFANQASHAGTSATRTPIDAGRLALAATASLNLDGILKADAGTNTDGDKGRGSEVDISAQDIQILGGAGVARDGYLQLDATQLSNLGAESLLIGGTRSDTAAGTVIDPTANSVILSNDASSALASPEIILVTKTDTTASDPNAANGLLLESGSVITAQGDIANPSTAPIVIGAEGGASGDGALLRVSNGAAVSVVRDNVPGLNGVTGAASGLLDIRSGAVINGGKSATLDSTGNLLLAPGATFTGDAVDVNANSMAFVGADSQATPSGFVVDPGLLAQFANIATLGLHSRSAMNFYGDVDLDVGQSLVLGAAAFTSDGGTVTISAPKLTLTNDTGAPDATFASGTGGLVLKAGELDFGAGDVTVQGFGSVSATATQGIVGQGTGNFDFGNLDVAMTAPIFMADSGANTAITTTGALSLNRGDGTAISRESLGGALSFTGSSITTDATIQALAGNLTLTATGGDLTVNDGASLSTAGINKTFFDTDTYAAGGALKLYANDGAIDVAQGAILAFGGAEKGGDAGNLTVSATGAVTLTGTLDGHVASADYRGSTFTLASGAAIDLDGIADLTATSGITGGLSVTSGQGNLVLSACKTLTGQVVYLEADGGHGPGSTDGNVIVNGAIDVSGQAAGHIDLYGQSGVDVEGKLLATSSVAEQDGGVVTIGTTGVAAGGYNARYGYENVQGTDSGSIHIGSGALIDVSGGSADAGGTISLRAPLLADGGVNIAVDNPASLKGASAVIIEPYAVWSTADATTGAQHFDGIVDPAGWYNADGSMVAGTWTDDKGNVLAAPTADQLSDYLANDYFTPDKANGDHTGFYGYADSDNNPGTVMGYVQAPGYTFGDRYAGIVNLALRPGIELDNPGDTVNGGNIDVLTNWNLGAGVTGPSGGITLAYRYQGQAPVLTVRADHDLNVNASITDGFYQQNDGAHLQDPVAPPPPPGNGNGQAYQDALAAYQTSTNFLNGFDDWNGTINLAAGSTSAGFVGPAGGVADISKDPYYAPITAPLTGQSDAYYANYGLYIGEVGNGSTFGKFADTFDFMNFFGFLNYNPTTLVAPKPSDYSTYQAYTAAYSSWLQSNFGSSPVAKKSSTPSPILVPIDADYTQYSSDYALYANGYDSYLTYVSTRVGNSLTGSQLFYAPFAPKSDPAGSPAYNVALAAYQASRDYLDANNIWTGTVKLRAGAVASGYAGPSGGTADITGDPYYTPITAPLTGQSDAYYTNYDLYIGDVGNATTTSQFANAFRSKSISGFLIYSPTTLVAPEPGDFTDYSDYITAYSTWLTGNFANTPVAKKSTTPSPLLLPVDADYDQYSTDYALYAGAYITQYMNYVNQKVGNALGTQLYYAPFAPKDDAATGDGSGGGKVAVAPSAANNSPSNMPIAGSPASLASATLLGGPSTSYRLVAGADFDSVDPLNPGLGSDGSVNGSGHFNVVDSATTDDSGNALDTRNALFGKTIVFPTVIRTGTGSIDIAAANDITLLDPLAPTAIYTGGEPADGTLSSGTGVQVFRAAAIPGGANVNMPDLLVTAPVQPDNGGDITLTAGGDILGNQQVYDTDGTITGIKGSFLTQNWWAWMTTGNVGGFQVAPTATSINFGNFDQGVMSAGGNVTVNAGGDINQLQVSLPTTWYRTDNGKTANVVGGGNLIVSAGGDILGGSYFVSKGTGDIRAGGEIGSAFTLANGSYLGTAFASPVATLLGLQDAQLDVSARGDVNIGGIYDPSWTRIPSSFNGSFVPDGQSYSADSAVHLTSTVGDIDFDTLNIPASYFSYGASVAEQNVVVPVRDGFLLPATLTMTALDGGISIGGPGQLYPSATGQLSLIADQDINLVYGWAGQGLAGQGFGLTDVKASLLPSILTPIHSGQQWNYLGGVSNAALATQQHDLLLHADDTQPLTVYSLNGSIISGHTEDSNAVLLGLQTNGLELYSVKPAQIEAGKDIINLAFEGQNFTDSDVTSIIAGRDIYDVQGIASSVFPTAYPSYVQVAEVQLGGPGALDVQAGRDLGPLHGNQPDNALTPTTGFQTVGNLYNPLLPRGGANISVLFGTGPGVAWDAFADAYLDPSAAKAELPSFNQDLIDAVAQYEADQDKRAGGAGDKPTLTADAAWDVFQTMPQALRHALIQKVFFEVLAVTGADENDPSSAYFGQYARGYQAINDLFPAALGYTENNLQGGANGAATQVSTGNLDIRGSTIQTQQGGDINIMGPGGQLLVGSTSSPPFIPGQIGPQSQGILAWETGTINIFSDQSLLLAQSRIFTERGGDMTLWSSNGDINAGQGVKTSSEIKPVSYLCNADFYCRINGASSVTGAGIAAFPAAPGDPAPTVVLAAPRGTVDFGDAGVRVAGNLIVAAQFVANADNVQVTGTTIGVPTNQVNVSANIDASSTAANAAQEAASAMQQARRNDRPSIFVVTIDGFGPAGDDCHDQQNCPAR